MGPRWVALSVALALCCVAVPLHADMAGAASPRPNIVFILTDDLSWNLITPQITPHIYQLEHQGETFTNYYVADSLCCPSRATIFTGLFPHDTNVTTNDPPYGGYTKFLSQGLTKRTFAVALQKSGYKTSMLGKYLNGYGDEGGGVLIPQGRKDDMTKANAPIPPGWSDWHVSNNTGYNEFNYYLNDNGKFNSLSVRTGHLRRRCLESRCPGIHQKERPPLAVPGRSGDVALPTRRTRRHRAMPRTSPG